MLGKLGWSAVTVVGGIFAEFVVYSFKDGWIALWNSGLSQISATPDHNMIRAFCQWLPLPLLILFIPGITLAVLIVLWRQPS